MPGINDSQANIDRVTEAAAAAGARSLYAGPLRLAVPVRDHFYSFLQHEFPDLLPWYLRNMEGQHLPKAAQERISDRARDARARFGLERDEARTRPRPDAPSGPDLRTIGDTAFRSGRSRRYSAPV